MIMPIEVGTPVVRRLPRRSRRAELPHRAPQGIAHLKPTSRTWCQSWFPLQAGSLMPLQGLLVSRGGALLALPPCPPLRPLAGATGLLVGKVNQKALPVVECHQESLPDRAAIYAPTGWPISFLSSGRMRRSFGGFQMSWASRCEKRPVVLAVSIPADETGAFGTVRHAPDVRGCGQGQGHPLGQVPASAQTRS
jgi:hypothetical protein